MDDVHLYVAVRYVENNSVRAGLAKRAEDYPWSSALSHVQGVKDSILSDDFPLLKEIADWREYLTISDKEVLVEGLRRKQNGVNLSIQTQRRDTTFKLGGSIAINGVCLTITDFSVDTFIVDVVKDTLTRTNLSMVRKNDSVNIELPLKVGDRLEGHILEG
ncbi:unnamed protein product, partial [marine sediment metagenome]